MNPAELVPDQQYTYATPGGPITLTYRNPRVDGLFVFRDGNANIHLPQRHVEEYLSPISEPRPLPESAREAAGRAAYNAFQRINRWKAAGPGQANAWPDLTAHAKACWIAAALDGAESLKGSERKFWEGKIRV